MRKQLGDDYFCGPSYAFDGNVDGKFECPNPVVLLGAVNPSNEALLVQKDAIEASKSQIALIDQKAKEEQSQDNANNATAINKATLRGVKAEAEKAATEKELGAAKAHASIDVAACTAANVTGTDCVLLMAVLKGQALPQVINSSVTPALTLKP